jgi:hypothetical protein
MKKLLLLITLSTIALSVRAQIAKDFMAGVNLDLIKSGNDGYFEKVQTSAELNYFITREFTATGGVEWWTSNNQVSLVMGSRWYPIPEAFIRVRGLIGANDVAVGGGWAKPLNVDWKFEAMGDIYFSGDVAIRAGLVYIIRRKVE